MSDVSVAAVIRALHDLHARADEWPTKGEIAEHLEVPERDVEPILRHLHAKRLFRPRQRRGRRVWVRWSE